MYGLLTIPSTPESSVLNAESEREEIVCLNLLTVPSFLFFFFFLRNNLDTDSEDSIFAEVEVSTSLKISSLVFLF